MTFGIESRTLVPYTVPRQQHIAIVSKVRFTGDESCLKRICLFVGMSNFVGYKAIQADSNDDVQSLMTSQAHRPPVIMKTNK